MSCLNTPACKYIIRMVMTFMVMMMSTAALFSIMVMVVMMLMLFMIVMMISLYQLIEKPENTVVLSPALKEKNMRTAMGANKNISISAV